jgi:lipoprotein-releasing system permease protein
MSASLFIANRIFRSREGAKSVSSPAVRVATASMALGLAVMLLSVAIVAGFKKEIRNKVIGFGSHIQIANFDSNNSYESTPVAVSDSLMTFLRNFPTVADVECFATKPGMLKTDTESQAMIFKGVDENYKWTFFSNNLIEGRLPALTADSLCNEALISRLMANRLNLHTGDSFIACFVTGENVRLRKLLISGIFNTGFSDYDKLYILFDIKQIRRLNGWDDDMSSGLELQLTDYAALDATAEALYMEMQWRHDRLGNTFYTRSIRQLNPPLFAWLDVLDTNVAVILTLMLLVAGFSMISGLLIIILERASMIGTLKALGQNNGQIRRIFLYISARLIARGLLLGNLIAFAVALLQKFTGFFRLDPDVYYLTEMPVDLNFATILAINAGTFIVTLLALVLPSCLVARISPAKTIRFE